MNTINQRIKEIRTTLGLSQAKFSKAIAVSNGYIAGIELEKRTVNERLIKLICSTYDVRESWLKTGEGAMFTEHSNNRFEQASSTFMELKPAYQEFILKQMNGLLEIQKNESTNLND